MSSMPGMRKRATAAPATQPPATLTEDETVNRAGEAKRLLKRPPLVERLPAMSDGHLLSLQTAAIRISKDPEHAKHASATSALPLIDAEIGRRTTALADGQAPDGGRPGE